MHPDVETVDSTIDLLRTSNEGMLSGVTWPAENTFPAVFAARASGHVCSSVHAWRQLELWATPGAQLRIDGVSVAATEHAATHPYPRGAAKRVSYFQWVEPGCHELELLFFEPHRCSANHVEVMELVHAEARAVQEVSIAYNNESALLCADAACGATVQAAVTAAARSMRLELSLANQQLTQRLVMLASDDTRIEESAVVRSLLSKRKLCRPTRTLVSWR